MRDEKEERKKQARSNKQTRQSNTAHPRQSLMYMYMYIQIIIIPTQVPTGWFGSAVCKYSTLESASTEPVYTCTCTVAVLFLKIHTCTCIFVHVQCSTCIHVRFAVKHFDPSAKSFAARTICRSVVSAQHTCIHVHCVHCVQAGVIKRQTSKLMTSGGRAPA